MIEIHLNNLTLQLEDDDMRKLIRVLVPEYFRDARIDAPDPMTDLVRDAFKAAMIMPTGLGKPTLFNVMMFNIYGANAPKLGRREDKLPYMWKAFEEFLLRKMRANYLAIQAEAIDSEETVYRILTAFAFPLQPGTQNEGEEQAQPAAAASTD